MSLEMERDTKFIIIFSVFLACISVLNVISAKLWTLNLGYLELTLSGGIIAYWLTFPVTDVVSEVFGKQRAQLVVWMGFLANVVVLGLSQMAIHLPASTLYSDQDALSRVLGAVPVIVIASLTAYLTAQLHDVWAYHFWKRITRGRHLWLRNNLSTMSSQLLDSIVFNSIAFVLLSQNPVSLTTFTNMTIGYWLFKLCISIMDTPVVYLMIFWFTGKWGSPPEKTTIENQAAGKSHDPAARSPAHPPV